MSRLCFLLPLLFLAGRSNANDITISNVSSYLFESAIPFIQFDLSWENSWRDDTGLKNHDAAWVFVKYKDNDGIWKHLQLNGSHNTIPGYIILDTNDGLGVFIYRSADGTGDVSLTGIELGAEPLPGSYEVKVYAVEMVFIPQGTFKAGDGDGISFSQGSLMKGDNKSYITVDANFLANVTSQGGFDDERLNTQGIGIDGDDGIDTNNDGTIDNPLYPTGYKAFYCMKYEVSLRGIVDFLNTLTADQQDRLGTNPYGESSPHMTDLGVEVLAPGGAGSAPAIFGIDTDGDGIYNETDDNETGAASDVRWYLLASYLDWAALRPMTELEFEKICRGTINPLLNEFAWGTTVVNSSAHTIVNPKSSDEAATVLNSNGNAVYGGQQTSSLRCGIFATESFSRKAAGAAYYGPMEMSGNAGETVVSLGNAAGRSFTGELGDGQITELGFADEDYWPGINGNDDPDVPNGVATTGASMNAGIGIRGGDFTDGAALLQLSNRQHATIMDLVVVGRGGRGVRQLN